MPQVTIYLDRETAKLVKKAAKAERVSLSKWIGSVLRQKTDRVWPRAVMDLEGAWPDFPAAEELRKQVSGDVPREV